MWVVYIRAQTAHSVQSDLDVLCPQKLLVSSSVRKELMLYIFPVDKKSSSIDTTKFFA